MGITVEWLTNLATGMQDKFYMWLLSLKEELMNGVVGWLKSAGVFTCDIVCVGIMLYGCVCAFKIITTKPHDKPKFDAMEKGIYVTIGYFIMRLMSLIIPAL